jgi:hypothetical protein
MSESGWVKGVAGIFAKFPHLLLGIGVVLCILAASTGIPGKLSIPIHGQLALGILGVALIISAVILYVLEGRRKHEAPAAAVPSLSLYKAEIHSPTQNTIVGPRIDAHGTVSKAPPGYAWRVLRGYPKGGVVPNGHIDIDGTGKWQVLGFEVGGESGKNDRRSLELWLVGENGRALLECWKNDHTIHTVAMNDIRRLTGKYGTWLDPIKTMTTDMVRCAKVDLIRS